MLYSKGQVRLVHRLSYEVHVGPISTGAQVLHSCDNRRCANPAHLRTGSHGDNMRDIVLRERKTTRKLTWEQVEQIRASSLSLRKLADQYGVCFSTIADVKSRKNYAVAPDRLTGTAK